MYLQLNKIRAAVIRACAVSLLLVFQQAAAATLTISCGAVGAEFQVCKSGALEWGRLHGHTVKVISAPNSSSERLGYYIRLFAAKSSDIDLFDVDVVWTKIMSRHLLDLDPYVPSEIRHQHFKASIESNIIDGKLKAIPWYIDVGMLFYRKDLLEKYRKPVPKTWTELTQTAKFIQDEERKRGNRDLWGYVFQGRAYEGLTCNALEWIYSFGGGPLVNNDRLLQLKNPKMLQALILASSWIGNITPYGVLNYTEEESRAIFQTGRAVFLRNWPYVWKLANTQESSIREKFGVTTLPKEDPKTEASGALGGFSLGVSKYSQHPELAANLAIYLTSSPEQKRRALLTGLNPTVMSLYKDEELRSTNPFLGQFFEIFNQAFQRPSNFVLKYNRLSLEFSIAVHNILSRKKTAEEELRRIEAKLDRIL